MVSTTFHGYIEKQEGISRRDPWTTFPYSFEDLFFPYFRAPFSQEKWWFPETGVPLVIIQSVIGFPRQTNHFGHPPLMEPPNNPSNSGYITHKFHINHSYWT